MTIGSKLVLVGVLVAAGWFGLALALRLLLALV